MSAPPPSTPEEREAAEREAEARRARRIALIRRRRIARRIGAASFLIVALLIAAAGLTLRYGVLTPAGRAFAVRLADGRSLGRLGRLHVEGLSGDLFGRFGLARLSIADAKGPWLEVQDLSLAWKPLELIERRFHAERLGAGLVRLNRRPELGPAEPSQGGRPPVSVEIDALALHLQTRAAATVRDGDWDLSGRAKLNRTGGADGRLRARSRLHAGDGLTADFALQPKGAVNLALDAVEANGGALAGALGLPADRRLFVHAVARSDPEGRGDLSVATQSGVAHPVIAKGSWSKDGARIDADLELDASRLTAYVAAAAGPRLHLAIRSRNIGGDRFEVTATAKARDASLALSGPLDWRRRRSDGLDLTVSASRLQNWADPVAVGPTRVAGVLRGEPARWTLEGRAELADYDQFGYRLARGQGPLKVSYGRGEVRIETQLATAGGSGTGLLPAILGAAPKLRLDGSRLSDGRYLVRDLGVEGPGLELKASGDRTLLGGLSLKGDIAVSNLERAHAGARGVVRANWTARQSGDDPWRISAQGQGDAFATGFAELDRLLGPRPGFDADAAFGEQGLTLVKSAIRGATLQAAVRGDVSRDARLGLDIDWSAEGPFAAGPVEIAGRAAGVGRITGPATAPDFDLSAELATIDFGRLVLKPAKVSLQGGLEGGLNGRIALSGASAWGPASARARFRFVDNGLDLEDIAADGAGVKAEGALALRSGAPSSADLTLAVGPGAFLSQGKLAGSVRIAETRGGAEARIVLDGERLAQPGGPVLLRTLKLRAEGPYDRLPFQLSLDAGGPVAWRVAGEGVLNQTDVGAEISREVAFTGQGRVRQADFRTLEPARIRLTGPESSARLRLAVGSGRVDFDARQAGELIEAKGELTGVDISTFAASYVGRISGDISLSGRGDRLEGVVDAAVDGGRDRDAPADVALSARIKAVLSDDRVRIEADATNPQGLTARLNSEIPAEASAAPFRVALVRNQPVSGTFDAQGELRPLWDLFAGGARTFSGRGAVHATLGGSLNELRPAGEASIEGGRFQDEGTGLDLRNLAVQASFDQSALNMRRFSGDDGRGGQLTGSGVVGLTPNSASTFTLDLKGFRLIDNELARASASGQVTVTRDAAGKARLAGALTVDRADITANPPVPTGVVPLDVIEVNRPGSDPGDAPFQAPGGPQIALDVAIRAARGLFIRGNGLDAELSLNAHVGGTTAAPELTGTAQVVRGDYQFAGKRFEFDERGVIRLGSHPEQVRLDLTATREDQTLRAIVRIQGTAARPEITLSSNPVLPEDEVLSQVLFGRSASQLSPLEAAQLASAVTGLATGGGFDVLGNLRQFARLDRLAVSGGGAGSSAIVSGGKYLTDDVYLELTGGGRQGPTAQVEWRVRRNFSLVSTVAAQGDARLSVRFRHNY